MTTTHIATGYKKKNAKSKNYQLTGDKRKAYYSLQKG